MSPFSSARTAAFGWFEECVYKKDQLEKIPKGFTASMREKRDVRNLPNETMNH